MPCGTRKARAARRARLASASAAIAPAVTWKRSSSCFAASTIINPDPRLAELEAEIMGTVNTLGVGPMGFGGKISLIGCKVGVQNRLPASFFVSIAYDCWAYRRLGVMLDGSTGAIKQWLYRDPSVRDDSDDGPGRLQADRPRDCAAGADRRSDDSILEGWRCRDGERPRLHRPRRGAPSPVESCAAGRSQRRRDLSLRSGGRETGRRRLEGHRRGSDDEHSRGAVSGRHHRQVRRARGDRKRAAWAERRWPG